MPKTQLAPTPAYPYLGLLIQCHFYPVQLTFSVRFHLIQASFNLVQLTRLAQCIIESVQQAHPNRLARQPMVHCVRPGSLAQLSNPAKIGQTRPNPSTQLSWIGQPGQPIHGPNLVNLVQPGSSPNSFPFLFPKYKLTPWIWGMMLKYFIFTVLLSFLLGFIPYLM
jgi:hypothetical protein